MFNIKLWLKHRGSTNYKNSVTNPTLKGMGLERGSNTRFLIQD
jgi:hypothetical protein